MNNPQPIDIISHTDEVTGEYSSWGVLYEDGSVRWHYTLEEATQHLDNALQTN